MSNRTFCDICGDEIEYHGTMLLYGNAHLTVEIRLNCLDSKLHPRVQGREQHICHDCIMDGIEKGHPIQTDFSRRK